MNYDLLALVLLIVGCGLIVAEIFLPSGGMISVMCVIAFLGSGWCAYRAWWETSPAYWWTYVGAVIVLIPTVIISLFRVLSNTSLGDRVLLAAPDPSEVTPYREEEAHLSQLIGKQGRTLTLLTPGRARRSGRRAAALFFGRDGDRTADTGRGGGGAWDAGDGSPRRSGRPADGHVGRAGGCGGTASVGGFVPA